MSSMPARPPRKSGYLASLLESFWIADVLVLTLLAFFIIVGGHSSPVLIAVGCVLAVLYAAHAVRRRHRVARQGRSMEDRLTRERRGF